MRTVICTFIALVAFAGNSILCRLALGSGRIDAASFTEIRLFSGALVLVGFMLTGSKNQKTGSRGSWKSAFLLFLYALTFSYAYISLETGTGALVLFSAVQATMILASLAAGNRLHLFEWAGILAAFSGFVYLVLPQLFLPTFNGFILMAASGVAWGFYTLAGKNSADPLQDTASNFIRTLPLLLICIVVTFHGRTVSKEGALLAVLSGSIASGAGYVLWYKALGGLSDVQAAVVQLFVPVIAGIGGICFMGESFSIRLAVSAIMILGGICAAVLARKEPGKNS